MAEAIMWDAALDALAAAPEHHQLLLEDEQVRVIMTRVPPGERTALHTHQWGGVLYVESWSSFVRYDDQGNVLVDSRTSKTTRQPGEVTWAAPLPPHSFENVGDTEFRVVTVEIKQPSVY